MENSKTVYGGTATRAWHPVIGCAEGLPCGARCWARKTIARVVDCQRKAHPERAAFFQRALSATGRYWSGQAFLDDSHLSDPLRWRKPQIVATGYHGDLFRLPDEQIDQVFAVMQHANWHRYLTLTKQPMRVLSYFAGKDLYPRWLDALNPIRATSAAHPIVPLSDPARFPLKQCWLGVSIMDQADADAAREHMAALAAAGWNTWISYEPAIGPVNWRGWEFLRWLVVGGESGPKARNCDIHWLRDALVWAQGAGVPCFVKQLGARPQSTPGTVGEVVCRLIRDRKGAEPEEWPEELRVRQMPEAHHD